MFRSLPTGDFSKVIEGWLTRGAAAAKLVKLTPADKQAESAFDMDVEFSAPALWTIDAKIVSWYLSPLWRAG
jgi:hypothetical protein